MSKEEIKIGDEVLHDTERYVVTGISLDDSYFCLSADGLGGYFGSVLEKTGRHFNQIENVLKQMNSHYDEFSFNRGNTKYEIYS